MQKTNNSELIELFLGYLTGNLDDNEIDTAIKKINESPANRKYFDELRSVFEASKITQKVHGYNEEISWKRITTKQQFNQLLNSSTKNNRNFILQIAKYAAMILLISSTAFLLNRYIKNTDTEVKEVWFVMESPRGSKSQIILGDGSKVLLNAGSSLKYSTLFGQQNRDIMLEGEAYFQVAHNKDLPFIVHTDSINIKVYGTEFNVKAYPDENFVYTTLIEGSVAISGGIVDRSGKEEVLLIPNQTAVIDVISQKGNIVINSEKKASLYTSWKDNKWIFDEEELGGLISILGRRYNIEIRTINDSIKKYRFTGTLKDETLEEVLKAIRISAPIDYNIQNNIVTLTSKK